MKSMILMLLSAWYSNYTVTDIVDSLEAQLAANRDAYLAGPLTRARQDAALQYFDQQWAWLKSPAACGSRALGTAGKACISDRSRTGRWPWENFYRDPIVKGGF